MITSVHILSLMDKTILIDLIYTYMCMPKTIAIYLIYFFTFNNLQIRLKIFCYDTLHIIRIGNSYVKWGNFTNNCETMYA